MAVSSGWDIWQCPPDTSQADFNALAMAYYRCCLHHAGYDFGPDIDGVRQTINRLERTLHEEAAVAACRYGIWMYHMVEGR